MVPGYAGGRGPTIRTRSTATSVAFYQRLEAERAERDIALYHLADAYLGVDSFTANLAMNCNLPAVILFAAKRDRLAYRSRVAPLAPEIRGDLRSLGAASIAHSLDTMLASRATQPLPV